MSSVYGDPEKTAAFMEHLEKNHDRMIVLRGIMKGPGVAMRDRVFAFSELYMLQKGDPHAQRRLVVELHVEAEKERATNQNKDPECHPPSTSTE